jgi:hypothetical protein
MFATAPKLSPPSAYWNSLTADDRSEFIRLRSHFHQCQKCSSSDRRGVTFSKELQVVLSFIERSPDNMESRCIVTGICVAGPVICINTRQLKVFLCRCKSSINGILQELGYLAIRTRTKTRQAIQVCLPSLDRDADLLRQWTVRYVSDGSLFCFVSSFAGPRLPMILNIVDDGIVYAIKEPEEQGLPVLFRIESLLSQPVRPRHQGVSWVRRGISQIYRQ